MDNRKENDLKKEYLKQYEHAHKQMQRAEEVLKEIRLGVMLPSVKLDGMPRSQNITDLSEQMIKMQRAEEEYIKYRYERLQKCVEIHSKIEAMRNEDEKDVLVNRYIKLMKWENICTKMDFSWRQIHRLHASALKNFKI